MKDFHPDEHQLRAVREFVRGSSARFWAKVDKSGECWIWTAAVFDNGYGKFKFWHDGVWKSVRAHRFSCDAIDDPRMVLHRCHNRRCVRPDHLYFGGQQDNMNDMVSAGRSARGDKNHNVKMEEFEIIAIRRALDRGEKLISISRRLNVPYKACARVKYGEAWKYIRS